MGKPKRTKALRVALSKPRPDGEIRRQRVLQAQLDERKRRLAERLDGQQIRERDWEEQE